MEAIHSLNIALVLIYYKSVISHNQKRKYRHIDLLAKQSMESNIPGKGNKVSMNWF